jgi:hypothetical protein
VQRSLREFAGLKERDGELRRKIVSQEEKLGVRAFAFCPELESVSVPSTGETIADECFHFCHKLRQVTFENGSRVSVLGDRAFSNCSSLASICIPSSVTRIGTECFYNCSSLATVTVESGIRVSAIGKSVFKNCAIPRELQPLLASQLQAGRWVV